MEITWRDLIVSQQDYIWFLAGLGHVVALIIWWLSARAAPSWRWLPWINGAGLCYVSGELIMLYGWPVRPRPNEQFFMWPDMIYGLVAAVQCWGLFHALGQPRRRLLPLLGVALAVVAALRYSHPGPMTLALCLAASLALSLHAWQTRQGPLYAVLLLATGAAVWLSPIGPLTVALSSLRRVNQFDAWGVWSSLGQAGVALGAVALLASSQWQETTCREWRRFAWIGVLWLAAGLGLAAFLANRSRLQFESSAISRAALAAALLDRPQLEAALAVMRPGPSTSRSQPDGTSIIVAAVAPEYPPAIAGIRHQLTVIERANPDSSLAMIDADVDGRRLVIAVPDIYPARKELVKVTGPTAQQAAGLRTADRGVFVPPHTAGAGSVGQARAPILGEGSRLLGWLVLRFPSSTWAASQVQSRFSAFVILTMGLGLGALSVVQRLRAAEREEALRAAAAAQIADQAKSEFIARVSHELRTPIQSLLGYSELLRNSGMDATSRLRLAALRQHGELMLRLVNDLLDLGAMQAAGFRLVPRPIQLVSLVKQTVESLRPRAEAKGLTFCFESSILPEIWFLADGERVRQVVLNVVGNAVKFTERGRVSTLLAHEPGSEMVVITVSDTGPGIPAESRGRIFQPFTRLEQTAGNEGTGLGLSLTAALCLEMKGDIRVEPTPEGGATFVVRLVLPGCPAPEPSPPAAIRPDLHGTRVLVVDDNTLIRQLFSAYLTEAGASCETVASGGRAIEHLARAECDVVLLDLAMPGMDGAETARLLRLRAPSRLRIVGISAHASEADKRAALNAGMDAFLTKPVELPDLARAIVATPVPAIPDTSPSRRLYETLLTQFRVEAPDLNQALSEAVARSEWPVICVKAHYLKNSADVMGLRVLSQACADLESAARDQDEAKTRTSAQTCHAALGEWL